MARILVWPEQELILNAQDLRSPDTQPFRKLLKLACREHPGRWAGEIPRWKGFWLLGPLGSPSLGLDHSSLEARPSPPRACPPASP